MTNPAPAPQTSASLSNLEKLQVLFTTLGQERVAVLMQSLDPDDAQRVMDVFITPPKTFSSEEIGKVLQEYMACMVKLVNDPTPRRVTPKALVSTDVANFIQESHEASDTETWEKLALISEETLANYLKTEYPQAVAVILSRLKPDQAARVIALFPEDFAQDVISRMLEMASITQEVLVDIEKTLKSEFISSVMDNAKNDMHVVLAEIFNRLDRGKDVEFLSIVEVINKDSAGKIRDLMFKFGDLRRLSSQDIRAILRHVDRSKLTLALKGTDEELRNLFLKNMPERAANLLRESLVELGAVRLRDVEDAQAAIVSKAKQLASQGEVTLMHKGVSEEMVD